MTLYRKCYYKLKHTPLCYKCGQDISGKQDIINKIIEQQKLYSIVLPSCQSAKCGSFKCERKKMIKRSAQGASAPAAKRRKKQEDDGK